MESVKVSDSCKSLLMPVINQKLKLKTLKNYFAGAAGLTFMKKGEICTLDINDDDTLMLLPGITDYEVYYSQTDTKKPGYGKEAWSERKKEIMARINNEECEVFKMPPIKGKKVLYLYKLYIFYIIMFY